MSTVIDGVLTTSSATAPERLDALAGVARDASIDNALAAARELLGMELAYLTEVEGREFRFAALAGDAEPFGGPVPELRIPRADTLCELMLGGAIDHLVGDVAATPAARAATASPGVGAYIGVPVTLGDGTVYGSLCCVSREASPDLADRDVRMLEVLARIIADQVELQADRSRAARLEGEAIAGQALLAALKAREHYTAQHSEAVVGIATAVAEELGLGEREVIEVAQVALLHDIGKLGVPDAILQKPGSLSEAEWRIMHAHPAMGERVVGSIPSLAHLAPAVRAEHERWDGRGYPDGLAGEAIPLASRICLACDAWHAMTSDRPYRDALGEGEARAELIRNAGTQFCPRTVDALLAVLDSTPAPPAAAPFAAAERQGPGEAELRALIAVAGAVSTAHRLEEVLEVVAEETHRVTGASIVSISRWEREHHQLRCLINVGDLRGRWERFPADEVYPLDTYPMAEPLLQEGTPYVVERADLSLPATDRQLLEDLEMDICVGVPVVVEGRIWGLLDVFAGGAGTPLSDRSVPFLEAIAGQVGAAIGRAELFAHVSALAFTDALTGLANRRALDERMESAIARGADVAVAFCDLDGLKQINDLAGHEAGDAAIRQAAEALRAAAGGHAGSFVSRIGGDEFCVVLEGAGAAALGAIAEAACGALAPHRLTFSCGVAALRPGDRPAD
ncbi:MAG: HD domain-containing phosphohydrolase, partial [Solirubrobacteraceae bacterium]